ncbi:MAG: nitronate monooxygenase [Cellvibrionales bacterium]|nr:nitronate monooxygenase [Cellvibrionales bacterium]
MVGCKFPIQQAGMGRGTATPRLASAVSNAGGLGMLSLSGYSPSVIQKIIETTKVLTNKKIGANFLLNNAVPNECIAKASENLDVIDFFWANPDKNIVKIVHAGGALAGWQVGSLKEAKLAESVGCDFVIVQSIEAGGHIRGHQKRIELLNEVIEKISIPILASGGFGSSNAISEVLKNGIAGVRCGTRFLAAKESNAHPEYIKHLIESNASDTLYTDKFCIGWPNAPHRVLKSCIEAAENFNGEYVGHSIDPNTREKKDIPRFGCVDIHSGLCGCIDAMPQWAGRSVDYVCKRESVAEIINQLMECQH